MDSQPHYDRRFWTIEVEIQWTRSGGAVLRIGRRDPDCRIEPRLFKLSPSSIQELGWGSVPEALAPGRISGFLSRLVAMQQSEYAGTPIWGFCGPRIALDIGDDKLAGLAWDAAFETIRWRTPVKRGCLIRVVHVVPTPPRVADRPLSLPFRVLQIGTSSTGGSLLSRFEDQHWLETAMFFDSVSPQDLPEWQLKTRWPTADILHISAGLPEDRLLTTAADADPLTLGWLSRLTTMLQTRLVVLESATEQDMPKAQVLSTALAARGGPAAIILPPADVEASHDDLIRTIYFELLHDRPLDVLLSFLREQQRSIVPVVLVGGVGREDLLRISNIVADLESLDDFDWTRPKTDVGEQAGRPIIVSPSPITRPGFPDSWSAPRRLRPVAIPGPRPSANSSFEDAPVPSVVRRRIQSGVLRGSEYWNYALGEGHGAVPAAETIKKVLASLGLDSIVAPSMAPSKLEPKYVNPLLARPLPDGVSVPVAQQRSSLEIGQRYFLHLDIGPRSELTMIFGLSPLQELDLTEVKGTWVEIGIMGLDFDVEGPLTRELHVPFGNLASDSVCFPVRPTRPGASRLRYSIYINQNLVRSYILAARTQEAGAKPGSARDLAEALGAPHRKLGHSGWVVRLEYSTTDGFSSEHPERALSIVSNHDDSGSSISVKGVDTFDVMISSALPTVTEKIREALGEISKPPNKDIHDPRLLPYGFGKDNSGSDEQLEQHLIRLAALGWKLFSKTIKDNEGVRRALEREGSVIHVAAMLRDEILPWSVMYDRQFDPRQRKDGAGRPVEHRACLAALPDANGSPSTVKCGEHPCLLFDGSGDRTPNVVSTTVACPSHFWGFRHVIELPPQTTSPESDDDAAPELATWVDNATRVRIVAGAHSGLAKQQEHFDQLRKHLEARTDLRDPIYDRDLVLSTLKKSSPDIIYFYCHAEATESSGDDPVLRLLEPGEDMEGLIMAEDFDAGPPWKHRPLVFLNACRTGAFRPDAISPFIDTLITKRRGGALIVSEIEVFERLAGDVADWLLTDFAGDEPKPVGPTLLRIRRRLLARRNVLGLVYTLYGASELQLKHSPKPRGI